MISLFSFFYYLGLRFEYLTWHDMTYFAQLNRTHVIYSQCVVCTNIGENRLLISRATIVILYQIKIISIKREDKRDPFSSKSASYIWRKGWSFFENIFYSISKHICPLFLICTSFHFGRTHVYALIMFRGKIGFEVKDWAVDFSSRRKCCFFFKDAEMLTVSAFLELFFSLVRAENRRIYPP